MNPGPGRTPLPRVFYVPSFTSAEELEARAASALREPFDASVAVLVRPLYGPIRDVLQALDRIVERAHAVGAEVYVRGRADLVQCASADGLHLPSGGLGTVEARQLIGARRVGRACHDAAELASAQDVDYALLSPIFSVPGKGEPLGMEEALRLARASAVPVLLLGGLDLEHAARAVREGAHGIAVQRAIDQAVRPDAAIRGFLSCVRSALAS